MCTSDALSESPSSLTGLRGRLSLKPPHTQQEEPGLTLSHRLSTSTSTGLEGPAHPGHSVHDPAASASPSALARADTPLDCS